MRDPVAVYDAANNLDAALVCEMLQSAGIDAHSVEDVSQVGAWMLGLLPGIHKPQVWVDKADVERAKPLLAEFERRAGAGNAKQDSQSMMQVVCEDCQKTSAFPASRVGSVEVCSHCGAYVDVGDDVGFEGWDEIERLNPDDV